MLNNKYTILFAGVSSKWPGAGLVATAHAQDTNPGSPFVFEVETLNP
jgi:hypothetical protein